MEARFTPAMKKSRLEFTIKYKDWTMEDWKRVIWTDETSVVLGHRRGNNRIWRTAQEGQEPVTSTRRERYKGFTEFMFWGCFSYDYKGPCHCWKSETAKEKKIAENHIKGLNDRLEPAA